MVILFSENGGKSNGGTGHSSIWPHRMRGNVAYWLQVGGCGVCEQGCLFSGYAGCRVLFLGGG